MCLGAILLARIPRLVFGARDPKAGACGSVLDFASDPRLNHRVEVVEGVLEEESQQMLSKFFKELRTQQLDGRTG
jgi:tRNA(adenine34) deaminase